MKIEELLQKIIDIANRDEAVDQTEFQSTEYDEPLGVFMPPLQLNAELMKKAVGVDNVLDTEEQDDFEDGWQDMAVDGECGCDGCPTCDEEDPLDAIRKNAGLPIDAEVVNPAAIVISQGTSAPQF